MTAPPRVRFVDPGGDLRELRPDLDIAYDRVIGSGQYISGQEVEAFESAFAEACGSECGVGVGNGLDALTAALAAAGIGPGDEVIVPAQTFIASWLAVTRVGARPVPVDVDEQTLTLDPDAVRAGISSRTVALMPVHLYGHPAEMSHLVEIAKRHGLFVLEDAAQAHGATYRGQPVGSIGDAAGFSFYPTKNLGALGDAGAITTNSPALAGAARAWCNYGSTARYVHDSLGVNSRLDPFQAAFLRVKLMWLERWNRRRSEVARSYLESLATVPGLTLPTVRSGSSHVWHLFCVRHDQRDRLAEHLTKRGIETLIHYPTPPHLTGAYASLGYASGSFPIAERAAMTSLSLPMGPHLRHDDVARVIDAVARFPS